MSKIFVYVLDRFVWLLLVFIFTTQALQLAGIMESPKGLGEITYTENNNYNYELAVGNNENRGKRQTEDRSKFIDSLFNLPIQTLNALNNLVQNSRPAFQKFRNYMQTKLDKTTTKAPETQTSLKKRSPVYIRPVGEDRELKNS